jgi:hypothetical protein
MGLRDDELSLPPLPRLQFLSHPPSVNVDSGDAVPEGVLESVRSETALVSRRR